MPLTPQQLNELIDRRNPSGLDGAAANKRLIEILHALADASNGSSSQVNSDWNSTSGVSQILNKPDLASIATSGSWNDLINKPVFNAGFVGLGNVSNVLQEPYLGLPLVDGYVLGSTAAGIRSWIPIPSSPVLSVFGRIGAILAQSGDYSFAQISAKPTTLSGYGITDGQPLNTKLTAIAALANTSGWLRNNGSGVFSYSTPTCTDVGADPAGAAASITLAGLGGVPTSRTVNSHPLSTDVVVSASDVGLGSVLNVAQEPALGNPASNGYILSSTTVGVRSWIAIPSAPVSSVFGRIGAVIAQSNDYTFAQIGSTPTTLAGYGINDAVPSTRTVNGHVLSANVTVTKSDVGLGSVENTELSTWAGSSNLTTIGTITTGVWNGSAISDSYISSAANWNSKEPAITAGTTAQYWRGDKTWQTLNSAAVGATTVGANLLGLSNPSAVTFLRVNADNTVSTLSASAMFNTLSPMVALGDTIYGGVAGAVARLPGNTTTIQKFLSQTGDGTNSAAPSWQVNASEGTHISYWQDTASSVSGYKQLISAPYSPKTTLSTASLAAGVTALKNWVTNAGFPNLTFIPAGTFSLHVHALQAAGTKTAQVYGEIWEVDSTGVDIAKIGTTEISSALTGSEAEYELAFVNPNTYTFASTASRVDIRMFATVSGGGSAPTVNLFYGGTADSHLSFPSSTVDATNFVPYSGAVFDLDLGTKKLLAGALSIVSTTQVYAFGDSLTENGEYEAHLMSLLGQGWNIINQGVSGDTTSRMIMRMPYDILLTGDAKYVIVWAGSNDAKADASAATIEANLQYIFTAIHNAGAKVVVVNISPWKNGPYWTSGRQSVTDAVNAWIASGSPANVDYKVDVYSLLVDPSNASTLLPAYDSGDHTHLSVAGYDVVANAVFSAVTWSAISSRLDLGIAANNLVFNQDVSSGGRPYFSRLTIGAGQPYFPTFTLLPGSLLGTPVSGCIENDGTGIYYTNSSASRRTVCFSGSTENQAFLSVAVPTTNGAGLVTLNKGYDVVIESVANRAAFAPGRCNGTLASPTKVESGDQIFTTTIKAYNGTGYSNAAAISCVVDGATTFGQQPPGRLEFWTAQSGGSILVRAGYFDSLQKFFALGAVDLAGAVNMQSTLSVSGNASFQQFGCNGQSPSGKWYWDGTLASLGTILHNIGFLL